MCILLILNDTLIPMPQKLDVEKCALNFYEYIVDG